MVNQHDRHKITTKLQEFVDNHFFWSITIFFAVLFTLIATLY